MTVILKVKDSKHGLNYRFFLDDKEYLELHDH